MNPEQAPAPNTGQYDFIINPEKAPKPKLNLIGNGGGSSFWIKIGAIVGGALVVMIIIAVVINIFFGARTNIDDLVSLTQTQHEVARVSALGAFGASDQSLRNVAESTQQTVLSQQQGWLAYLKKNGRTVKDKELALKTDKTTDQRLTLAQQSNTYDTTFRQTLRQELEAYATQLKTAHDNASKTDERNSLNDDYNNVQILLKQLPQN